LFAFFRVGDFYETFGEDAVSFKNTGITLTKRGAGSETETALAGFPSFDKYLFTKIS
jgi:DNA mismatch repair protein MutS